MARNPFRRPWDPIGQRFLLESKCTSFRRVLWAARHACKRLRERCQLHARTCHELKTDNERLQQRLAEVESDRDQLADAQARLALDLRTTQGRLAEANSKLNEWQCMFRDVSLGLDDEHTKLTTAQQENARLRQELRNSRETTEQTNTDIWAALNGDKPICGPVTATAAIIKLRAERGEARGRAELAAHNGKVEYQRAEDYWKQLTAAQQEAARLREALENLADCTGAVAERFRYVRTDTAEARAHNGVIQALSQAVRDARAALAAREETSGEPSELEDDDA